MEDSESLTIVTQAAVQAAIAVMMFRDTDTGPWLPKKTKPV